MIYKKQEALTNFTFWGGARSHEFSHTELQIIDDNICEIFAITQPTETEINDLFWFDEEFLCEFIGLDLEEYEDRPKKIYI